MEHDSTNTEELDNKVIYLTFDDGPSEYTTRLLDILDRYGIKATFFTTCKHPSFESIISIEAKRGHKVALHSYSHDYSLIYSSEKSFFEDINKMKDIIEKQTGKRTKLLRFPGGSSNTVSARYSDKIMSRLAKEVTDKGYIYVDWNVCGEEAVSKASVFDVTANVINGISKHKESIVLLHDDVLSAVDATEGIIKWGLDNGYTFSSITDGSLIVHHKVAN